jgi:hypothetical protein
MGSSSKRTDCQAVLRAAGETETAQGNIQDWLQLDEIDTEFQYLTRQEIAAVILLFILSGLDTLVNCQCNCSFINYIYVLMLFSFINPDKRLIRMTPPN